MADLNVIYRIAADITGLQDGVKRAAEATESLESTVGRVGKAIVGAFSVHQVLEFGRVTTQAFGEQESALRKLEAALLAQGMLTPVVSQQYKDLAAQFQQTTVFSDDLVTEMQALLVQVGNVMPNQMEGALEAATNLAAGLGIDLRTATMLVGKAFEGETGTLKRYGIVIDETKLKAGGTAVVLEAINQKFGGQAQAQIQTYNGKLAQFNNTLNDSQEDIGGVVTQGLTPMLDLFKKLPGPLQTVVGGVQALSPNLETLVLGLLAIGGPAKAGALATGALSGLASAASALWPVLAVGATAFGSWKIGTWIGEVTSLTDGIEWLSGRLMGLSTEQINASRYAREHRDEIIALDGALARLAENSKTLSTIGLGLKSVALTGTEVTDVIREMDAALRTANAQAQVREEEEKKRAAAAKARAEEQLAIIELNARTQAEAQRARLAQIEFLALRDMEEAAATAQRVKQEEEDYAALVAANASAHQDMLEEIRVANMYAERARMDAAEREKGAWKTHVADLASSFEQLAQIAGGAFSGISRGIGIMISSLTGAISAVDTLKSGFGSLGAGNTLKGIASIASGIGGIVGIATTAIGVVKSLWNWANGGEIGQVVNPARDAFFNRYGGLEGVNQAAEAAGDTTFETTRNIFGARTSAELDRAIEAWLSRTGIPRLAAGGLVTQPTLAMLGESGPELVTPLHKLDLGNDRPLIIPVYVDGRKIAQASVRHFPRAVEQWVGA